MKQLGRVFAVTRPSRPSMLSLIYTPLKVLGGGLIKILEIAVRIRKGRLDLSGMAFFHEK